MSQRYWVGGTADWDSTAGSKWATTSGGAGGAAVPTSVDDVYFDGNSGAGTATVVASSKVYCKNLVFTGYTGTFDFGLSSSIYVSGTVVTFHSGMSLANGGVMRFLTSNCALTAGGLDLSSFALWPEGGGVICQDNMSVGYIIFYAVGAFNANNKNITFGRISGSTSSACTITMGSGTWTCTSTTSSVWYLKNLTNLTLNCNTSTLAISYTGSTYDVTFHGGGKTYNKLLLSGFTSKKFIFLDSSVFSEIETDRTGGDVNLEFTTGTTTTATTWTAAVSGTNKLYFRSTTTTNATIAKAGGGTVQLYYMDIDYITGGAANTFYVGNALTSTDGGHNTQIYFTSPSITDPTNAYADDANYATGATSDGKVYVQLSWDAGTTWSSTKFVTFAGGETTEVLGDGETELWGRTWSGSNVSDADFRLRVLSPFWQRIYKTYGFALGAGITLTGIKVSVKGKWDGTTTSINYIPVAIYYGTSLIPVKAGSIAFASDGRKAGEGAGAGSGVQTFYDGTNWIAVDTGAAVAA